MSEPGYQQDDQGQRLKGGIERGVSGDKIAFPDPAAAALGTDDEAAGQSPTAGTPASGDSPTPSGEPDFRNPGGEVRGSTTPRLFFLLGFGVLVGAVLVIALALMG